jgi:hypothetical protein
MRRLLWLIAFLMVCTGCADSPVSPVQRSSSWTMTFVEPADPTETCCPSSGTGTSHSCADDCCNSSCCPSSHCDKDGNHK